MIQKTSPGPLRLSAESEDLEIVSPDGRSEVRIAFTPDGPVVTIRGARIRLDAEDLRLRCQTFRVDAKSDIVLRARGDVNVDGAIVRLNCSEPGK